MLVRRRQLMRLCEQLAVALADPHPLQCHQGRVEQSAKLRKHLCDPLSGPDGDQHHRYIGVASEQPRARSTAATRAVDAEKDTRPSQAAAVHEVTERNVGRSVTCAILASEIDRQLRGLPKLIGQLHLPYLSGQQPRPFKGYEPATLDLKQLLQQQLDAGALVDGDRNNREIFGQRQKPVGVQVVEPAESFCTP